MSATENTIPTPLPPSSGKLRRFRYHVSVHGARNDRGAYPFIAEGRFTSLDVARQWADLAHADAPFVSVEYLTASNGWRRSNPVQRIEGKWSA